MCEQWKSNHLQVLSLSEFFAMRVFLREEGEWKHSPKVCYAMELFRHAQSIWRDLFLQLSFLGRPFLTSATASHSLLLPQYSPGGLQSVMAAAVSANQAALHATVFISLGLRLLGKSECVSSRDWNAMHAFSDAIRHVPEKDKPELETDLFSAAAEGNIFEMIRIFGESVISNDDILTTLQLHHVAQAGWTEKTLKKHVRRVLAPIKRGEAPPPFDPSLEAHMMLILSMLAKVGVIVIEETPRLWRYLKSDDVKNPLIIVLVYYADGHWNSTIDVDPTDDEPRAEDEDQESNHEDEEPDSEYSPPSSRPSRRSGHSSKVREGDGIMGVRLLLFGCVFVSLRLLN